MIWTSGKKGFNKLSIRIGKTKDHLIFRECTYYNITYYEKSMVFCWDPPGVTT
jgi:hypothetical protein